MTSGADPDDSGTAEERSQEERAAAAAYLLGWVGERRAVSPPPHVVRDVTRGKSDRQEILDALNGFVAPHWNRTVRQVKETGGYLSLVARSARLNRHLEDARDEAESAAREAGSFRSLFRILRTEARRHGASETLGSTLLRQADEALESGRSGMWKPSRAALSSGRPDRFVLDTSESADLLNRVVDLPPEHRTFRADLTWREATEVTERRYRALVDDDSDLESKKRLFQTVRFRRDIVDAVLTEYDIFDHVPEYDGLEWHLPRYDEIVDAALIANDTDYFLNRLADVLKEEQCTGKQAVQHLRSIAEKALGGSPILPYEPTASGRRSPDDHVKAIGEALSGGKALEGVRLTGLKAEGRDGLSEGVRQPR